MVLTWKENVKDSLLQVFRYHHFQFQGWRSIKEDNACDIAKDMPSVSPTTLYTYLAEGVGNAKVSQAFRALKRGYIHWASGRLSKLEVHTLHPVYSFIRASIVPSMRTGTYLVKIILKKLRVGDQVIGSVCQASCECAAGLSASCVHISALLHALVALKPGTQYCETEDESDEESLPVTSMSCQWKPPKRRKVSAMQVSTAEFEKYEYGKTKKFNIQSLELYDPRPEQMRNKIINRIPKLLDEVRGKGLCISLLLDSSLCVDIPKQKHLTKEELVENQ